MIKVLIDCLNGGNDTVGSQYNTAQWNKKLLLNKLEHLIGHFRRDVFYRDCTVY